jgi:hypothetical protein
MVKVGGTQRTAIGVIGFEAVEVVGRDWITDDEARRAGFDSAEQLLGFLDRRPTGEIYRIRLRGAGPDPRVALRAQLPNEAELDELERRLARLDRSSTHGAWTRDVLEAIASNPERRAGELAARLGRERLPFKVDVRKLKELGLTESLPIGYRLSARGHALLERLRGGAVR